MQRFIMSIGIVLMVATLSAAKLPSTQPQQPITIDGNLDEWTNATYELKGKDINVGVMNDSDWLYICIYPTSRERGIQFIHQGFTLWLNQYGKNKTGQGISFPGMMANPGTRNGDKSQRQTSVTQSRPDANTTPTNLMVKYGEREISYSFDDLVGLSCATAQQSAGPGYELKIPLRDNDAYSFSLDASGTTTIAVGLESKRPQMDKDRSDKGQKMGNGQRPGGRGNGGGMGRGPRGNEDDEDGEVSSTPASDLSVWVKVKLTG